MALAEAVAVYSGIDTAPWWYVVLAWMVGQPVLLGSVAGFANRWLQPATLWSLGAVMGGTVIALQCLVAVPDNVDKGCLLPTPPHPTTDWCFDQSLALLLAPYAVGTLTLIGFALGTLPARWLWRRDGVTHDAAPAGLTKEWRPSRKLLAVPAILALIPWTVGSVAELAYELLGKAVTG